MSNWIEGVTIPTDCGWLGCPHCNGHMRRIFLPSDVRGDFPDRDTCAPAGIYEADFNPHGAATVKASNGRRLGVEPDEFQWLHSVPPYDRWCKGKGGLHQ